MEFTGERFVPVDTIEARLAQEHWHRYLWANSFVKNKRVLDIACGEGFGSNFLAKDAEFVFGADISEETIDHAQKKYHKDNLKFSVMSVDKIELEDNSIDVVVSFETIEHVDYSTQEKMIAEFSRILKEDGILCISTPGTESPRHCAGNEFHVQECSYEEFRTLLLQKFKYVRIFGQSVYHASVIGDAETDVKILNKKFNKYDEPYQPDMKEDKYLMAVCSNSEIEGLSINSVMIDRAFFPPVVEEVKLVRNKYNLLKSLIYLCKITLYTILEKISSGEKSLSYCEEKEKYIKRMWLL